MDTPMQSSAETHLLLFLQLFILQVTFQFIGQLLYLSVKGLVSFLSSNFKFSTDS